MSIQDFLMLTFLLIQGTFFHGVIAAFQLAGCGDSNVMEVVENSRPSYNLTCQEYLNTVTWTYQQARPVSQTVNLGECTTASCTRRPAVPSTFNLTFINASASYVAVLGTSRVFGGLMFYCDDGKQKLSCAADVIVPAVLFQATLTYYTQAADDWMLIASTIITTVYSSFARYTCEWKHSIGGGTENAVSGVMLNLTPSSSDISNNTNRTGSCYISSSFPRDAGNHTYRVVVSPGNTSTSVSINIVDPADLSHNCTSGYIKEGSTLNCYCICHRLGDPPASLTWSGLNSSQLRVPNVNSSLNEDRYNCEVRRGSFVVKSIQYRLQVAYGPRTVTVNGPSLPFDTDDTKMITLQCIASMYNPSITYVWRRESSNTVVSKDMFYNFTAKASDDGANITCLAANIQYDDIQKRSDVYTLDFNYPPSTAPTIASYKNDIYYAGENVTLVCTVRGGKPLVTQVNFFCDRKQDRSDVMEQDGVSSSVQFNPIGSDDDGQTCTCTAEWKNNTLYTRTATARLTVYYRPVQPVVKLNNTHSTLTVSEQNLVVLTCLTGGRPKPRITLDKSGGGQVFLVTGEDPDVAERESWLNHTLPNLKCEDAGNYTCTAQNNVGSRASTVSLFVNCKPRLVSVSETPPSVNYVNQSVYLSFDMLAYPLPTTSRFVYLGNVLNNSNPQMAVSNISLDAKCRVHGQVYDVSCVVTVNNVTEKYAGYYRLDLSNAQGAGSFLFQVKFNDSNVPVQDKSVFPVGAAVGGGLAAAAAVVITVVAVVLFSRRQRKGSRQAGKGKRDGRKREEPGDETMIVNNLYGTRENTAAHESQTRTPQRSEYEVVALPPAPKPHVQPPSPVAAKMSTANDEKDTNLFVQKGCKPASNPADTVEYASVDKSKTATVSRQNGETAAQTGIAPKNKSKAMQKPAQKPKPTKKKFIKKAQKEKKEDEQKLRKTPEFTEGAGNMPLSMNPIDCKVYENFGFQHVESETKLRDPLQEPADDQRNVKKDGLVYTTIQFTESQQKKAEHTPPKRETTEYVPIVFSKHPTSISGD